MPNPFEPPAGMTFRQWADSFGLHESTLRDRIKRGIPPEAPKVSPCECGLRGLKASAQKLKPLVPRIQPGEPHRFHRLLYRMAVV